MIPWCSKWSGALSDPLSGALSDPLTVYPARQISATVLPLLCHLSTGKMRNWQKPEPNKWFRRLSTSSTRLILTLGRTIVICVLVWESWCEAIVRNFTVSQIADYSCMLIALQANSLGFSRPAWMHDWHWLPIVSVSFCADQTSASVMPVFTWDIAVVSDVFGHRWEAKTCQNMPKPIAEMSPLASCVPNVPRMAAEKLTWRSVELKDPRTKGTCNRMNWCSWYIKISMY